MSKTNKQKIDEWAGGTAVYVLLAKREGQDMAFAIIDEINNSDYVLYEKTAVSAIKAMDRAVAFESIGSYILDYSDTTQEDITIATATAMLNDLVWERVHQHRDNDPCTACNGTGTITETCDYCVNGITQCPTCGNDMACEECDGTGTFEEKCDKCNGTGLEYSDVTF